MSDKRMNDKEQVTTRIRSLGYDLKTALDILEQITDPDPCRLDHNGQKTPITIDCECAADLATEIKRIKKALRGDGALHVSIKVRERI